MKHTQFAYVLAIIILSASLSCTKTTPDNPGNQGSGCNSSDSLAYLASINGFDFTLGSPYYNQAIVNFKFTQLETTCPSTSSSTDLIIQNLTNNTVSFAYSIIFRLNYVSWNYQNAVVIPPHSSVDEGQVNSNPARIDFGTISIQGSNITYN